MVVLLVHPVLQESPLACLAGALPLVLQMHLVAADILVDLQLQVQAAENLRGLEGTGLGRVYPCLPLVVLP